MQGFVLRAMGTLFFLIMAMATASCSMHDVAPDELILTDTGMPRGISPLNQDEARVERVDLKTVYFDYDKYTLKSQAIKALKENLAWLKTNPTANLQIEGHCDERGTEEYNFNLGEKRANAVKNYLVSAGISHSRISVVSYGASRGGKSTWSKNRKAVFIVIYPK